MRFLLQSAPMVRAPDLVLLDVRMQGMDGVQTLRRLREVAPATSVIMVTANEDVGLAGLAQAGASQDAAAPMSADLTVVQSAVELARQALRTR